MTQASHNDILRRIDEEARDREAFRRQSAESTAAILRTLQVLGQAIEGVEARLGEEPDSDGTGGRGILGDLAQIKAKVLAFDILKARVLGGVAVAVTLGGAFFAALWWAFSEKIEHFFKGGPAT